MYTLLEAHDLAEKFKHLEGKYFIHPKDGLYYEIGSVIPAPIDDKFQREMLEICYSLASEESPGRDALADYMLKLPDEVEFEVVAMGMASIGNKCIFHLVPLPFGLSKANPNLGCDYIVRVIGNGQERLVPASPLK